MSRPAEVGKAIVKPAKSVIEGVKEMPVLGKLYAANAALFLTVAGMGGAVFIERDEVEGGAMFGISVAAVVGFGYAAIKERRRRAEEMLGRRRFSRRSDFGEYEHTDQDTYQSFTSPFPVAVTGINDEILGVGELIGSIGAGSYYRGEPVIAIEDPKSPDGQIEFLAGSECSWLPLDEEIIEALSTAQAEQSRIPAYEYAKSLDL